MTLDGFLLNVRKFSKAADHSHHLQALAADCTEHLLKNAHLLDSALDSLEVQAHSVGVLCLLRAKFSLLVGSASNAGSGGGGAAAVPAAPVPNLGAGAGHVVDWEQLCAQTCQFFTNCNSEQVRLVPDLMCQVGRLLAGQLAERGQALRGLLALRCAVERLQCSRAELTPLHADLCQLSLQARCFKPILDLLAHDISEIKSEHRCTFDARDYLLYYYYGAMIYLAVKRYERAFSFFENALVVPALAVSQIMVEAYKKWLLVGVLVTGEIPVLPKYAQSLAHRYLKQGAGPYPELVAALAARRSQLVAELIDKYADVLTRDHNFGLVRQCARRLRKANILRLTRTFLTLTLEDVARRAELRDAAEAEATLLELIQDAEIHARINQKDGMVRFYDNPERYTTSGMLNRLQEELNSCTSLDRQLHDMIDEVVKHPQFAMKQLASEQEGKISTGGGIGS